MSFFCRIVPSVKPVSQSTQITSNSAADSSSPVLPATRSSTSVSGKPPVVASASAASSSLFDSLGDDFVDDDPLSSVLSPPKFDTPSELDSVRDILKPPRMGGGDNEGLIKKKKKKKKSIFD